MKMLPGYFDQLLMLPLPLMALFLIVYWGLFALLVHRFLVPWIAGIEGQKLGRFEAEVPAQIGLAFGLLVSFIAIPVWEQHSLAEEASRSEAAAYREMLLSIEDSSPETREPLVASLQEAVNFLVVSEWPQMASLKAPRVSAPPLRELRAAVRSIPEGSLRTDLHEFLRQASDSRETRLRIAATRPPPARWGIVGVLAILTLLGVGLIHAESRRARRMALGMVAVGIACCFMILFAYSRPYLGQYAIQPDDLCILLAQMTDGDLSSHLSEL